MRTLEELMGSTHRHAVAEVLGWAKRLRHFYFMGEVSSGQMDLYEELQMRLTFAGRDDLIHLLGALGLLKYGVGPPPAYYTVGGESRVTVHPDLTQPGHCKLAGSTCYVSVQSEFIDVSCAADDHVSAANVEDAVRIEALIDRLQLQSRVNRTIATHANCVSAERYPGEFGRQS